MVAFTSSAVRRSEGIPNKFCISVILNSTTGSILGLLLSGQYKSSTNSYILLKSTAASFFLTDDPPAPVLLYLQIQADFFFILLKHFYHPILLYHFQHKKAPLSGDFFDRLKSVHLLNGFFK